MGTPKERKGSMGCLRGYGRHWEAQGSRPGPELVSKGLPHPDAPSALLNNPYGHLTIASGRARSGAH